MPSVPTSFPALYNIPTTIPSNQLELDFDEPEEKIEDSGGCVCKKCGEYYPYADPPEPEKFNCYACRHGL